MTRHAMLVVLGAMVLVGVVAQALSQPAAGPATQPSEAGIRQLVAQLGDEDFRVRLRAGEELRTIGGDALPALRDAARSADPEVQTRAESLIREIEKPMEPEQLQEQLPGVDGRMLRPFRMQKQFRVDVRLGGGRSIMINENGRVSSLVENADGVTLSVTEPDAEGKNQTKEYKAKNAEELKKKHPEAGAIYDRLNKQNQINVIRPGMPRDLQKLLKERRARLPIPLMENDRPNIERFGLDVEETTEAMKAQLGEGVVVSSVEPDSRGGKIGLKELDLIQKINDRRIASMDDLETAVDSEDPLTIEILRAGKSVKLQEKKAE